MNEKMIIIQNNLKKTWRKTAGKLFKFRFCVTAKIVDKEVAGSSSHIPVELTKPFEEEITAHNADEALAIAVNKVHNLLSCRSIAGSWKVTRI